MPPFGNLYGLRTYVDERLARQDYIVFEAGTHTDAIKLRVHRLRKNRQASSGILNHLGASIKGWLR